MSPGNSGGPLLDGEGRAVGIVTLKLLGADGVGFALPLEYARAAAGLPAPVEEARGRWAEVLARVAAEDDAEARALVERLERPRLHSAIRNPGSRIAVTVLQRWGFRPSAVPLAVEVRWSDGTRCERSGTATEWGPLGDRLDGRASGQDRHLRWMLRRKLEAGVYVGAAQVDLSGCPLGPGPVLVALRGNEDEAQELGRAPFALDRADPEAWLARQRARERAEEERRWRDAFAAARRRVEELEARRRELEEIVDRQLDLRRLDAARRDLPKVAAALAQAREALDDLERRASYAAVPREWR